MLHLKKVEGKLQKGCIRLVELTVEIVHLPISNFSDILVISLKGAIL